MALRYEQPEGRIEDPLRDARSDTRGKRGRYRPEGDDAEWVHQMRAAVQVAQDFISENLESDWTDSLAAFNSEHPSGSKYHEDFMASRTKLFRPKTRSMLRHHEAAAANAFFTNPDVVTITASDGRSDQMVAAGKVLHEVVNLRLTRTIPWFQFVIGAFQTGRVFGACAARVEWQYERRMKLDYRPAMDLMGQPMIDPESGLPLYEEFDREIIEKDRPWIELVPLENFLIDPGSSWLEPVESSPWLIERIPMFLSEVRRMQTNEDEKTGNPLWRDVEESELYGGEESDTSSAIRTARTSNRQDRYGDDMTRDDDIVWVHRNIFRQDDGEDWQWYSVGDYRLLSDPVPLVDATQIEHRPYVFGAGMLEAHQLYPSSLVRMVRDLQSIANEITNLGLDNTKMNLAPLTMVKADADVDIDALLTRAPYSIIELESMSDVAYDRPDDMGPSRFAEGDRINVDFDEIAGTFSQSSVATNRNLNETVGGMEIMTATAGGIVDFDMRLFSGFIEKVLYKLVRIEQKFETDEVILGVASKQAQMRGPLTPEMMNTDVIVSCNVGVGATNPDKRLANFMKGLEAIGKVFGTAGQKRADFESITDEVFGLLGYDSGERFFLEAEDQATSALMEHVKQLEAKIAEEQPKNEAQIKIAEIRAKADLMEAQIRADVEKLKVEMQTRLGIAQMRVDAAGAGQEMQQQRESHKLDMVGKVVDLKATQAKAQIQADSAREMASIARDAKVQDAEISRQTKIEGAKVDQQTKQQAGQAKIAGNIATTKAKIAGQVAMAKAVPPAKPNGSSKAPRQPSTIDMGELDALFEELEATAGGPMMPASAGQMPAQAPEEREDGLAQALASIGQSNAAIAQALAQLARVMAAPKELVPGPDGKPTRVRTLVGAQ